MKPNPVSDALAFLLQPGWTTPVFWLLLLANIAVAGYVLRTMPEQRRLEHVGNWIFRVLIGCMWWQMVYRGGLRLTLG